MMHQEMPRHIPSSTPSRDLLDWDIPRDDYAPTYSVSSEVLAQDRTILPGGWADPEDIGQVTLPTESFAGPIRLDPSGYPLNPSGRTGVCGRGALGKWGPNYSVDPIILRSHPDTGGLQAVIIRRDDTGALALPGGMMEAGEEIAETLHRELFEETNISLDFSSAAVVYRGVVRDPRDTDNAWIETTAAFLYLSDEIGATIVPRAGDDAKEAMWMDVEEALAGELHATHGEMLALAIRALQATPTEP